MNFVLPHQVVMKLNLNNWSSRLLYLLLATDILFIALHIIYKTTELTSNSSFSLEMDRGYPEIFQYIKEYWIALLFLFLALRKQVLIYGVWSLLFLYLLLDDYLKIHEIGGEMISEKLNFPAILNLRAVDLGELLVSISVSLFFLVLISITYRFSNSMARQVSKYIIALLFLLAFFGIVTDMVHIMTESLSIELLNDFMGLVEDGGEHLVMTLIAWFVFLLFDSPSDNPISKLKFPGVLKFPNTNVRSPF